MIDFEFYETPEAFTSYLFRELDNLQHPIAGQICEPCVGDGAIRRVCDQLQTYLPWNDTRWVTNDLDPRWIADYNEDAASVTLWEQINARQQIDWTVSNPPFTPAIDIVTAALKYSRIGVAMHLRASIHEVLKTGIRRTFLSQHTPTGILWLPRFAYQRSKTTGKWTTDSVCACWVIWLKSPNARQFIRYAPESVIDALDAETPAYRTRMDALMATLRKTA